MDVIFPIKYIQQYLPNKRCSKARDVVRTQEYAVYVQDIVDERDFPVAFKVRTYESVLPKVRDNEQAWELCHHGNGGKGTWFTETIRRYKGKLYRPIRHGYGSSIARSFVNPKEHIYNELEWFQNCSCFKYVGVPKEGCDIDLKGAILVKDNYAENKNAIKKESKRFVVYKGVLWRQTEEPLYTYTTFGLGGNHGGTGFFVEYGRRTHASKKIYWHADQREAAIKAAIKVATGRGDTESVPLIKNAKELITKF